MGFDVRTERIQEDIKLIPAHLPFRRIRIKRQTLNTTRLFFSFGSFFCFLELSLTRPFGSVVFCFLFFVFLFLWCFGKLPYFQENQSARTIRRSVGASLLFFWGPLRVIDCASLKQYRAATEKDLCDGYIYLPRANHPMDFAISVRNSMARYATGRRPISHQSPMSARFQWAGPRMCI
jgi:hypothetical protein